MSDHESSIYSQLLIPTFIFLASFLSCLLPRLLSNSKIVRKYFSLVNVFTAGLQLATIIVDLIPHMNLKKGAHFHGSDLYPFVATGICFILLLSIDSIFLHSHSSTEKISEKKNEQTSEHKHVHGSNCKHNHTSNANSNISAHNANTCNHDDHENHCHENLGTCNTNAISKSQTKTKAILLLLAISIHSFFEGFAMDVNSKHIPLLAGIFFHKILESFAIGSSINQSIFSGYSKIFLFLIYSILTPLSVFIRGSDIFSKNYSLQQWGNGLCLGALMFVVFFEVIGHSFHGGKDNIKKVFAISLGYVLGCTSIILAHGEHDHHHDHHGHDHHH